MSNNQKTFRIRAFDTLFFKESRPFEAIGGSELTSLFPPPPRTILGAVRTAIGDAKGVNWTAFKNGSDEAKEVREIIGYGDDLGSLSLDGVWLSIAKSESLKDEPTFERLFPAPLMVLKKILVDGDEEFERLQIGEAVQTHMGMAHLPELPKGKVGFKPLESCWLTLSGLASVLAGNTPDKQDVWGEGDLFSKESRLGITRNNQTRTVEEKMLYQSRHIRPQANLAIDFDISGVPDDLINERVLRLGAEGRLAGMMLVDQAKQETFPSAPKVTNDTCGIVLTLLSPAYFGDQKWKPSEFTLEKGQSSETKVPVKWHGELSGMKLTLHAAVIGKAQREGGWNVAEHKPRGVQSLIPAGSCFYCTVDDGDIQATIDALHGQFIGQQTELGRGRVVCALLKESEFTGTTL